MKKKVVVTLACALGMSMLMTGCQASTNLTTDNITISKYKGVEVDQVEKTEVTDDDVESRIETVLSENKTETEITDRAVQEGDIAYIDYVGSVNGKEFDGGSYDNYPLEIGSGSFIDGFEDAIIGHKTGEKFKIKVTFPDDYSNTDLAGKKATFKITLNKIVEQTTPELTDAFVQTVSEDGATTVDEYKEEIRKDLEEEAEETYESTLEEEAWDAVLENTEVTEYPEDELQELKDNIVSQYQQVAEYYGMEYADFLTTYMGCDEDAFNEQVATAAEDNLKQKMVVEALADKLGLSVSSDDEDYTERVEALAKENNYDSAEALQEVADEEDINQVLLQDDVKAWLAENCIQVATSN